MVVLMGSVASGRAGGRLVVSLDGTWDIAEGDMERAYRPGSTIG